MATATPTSVTDATCALVDLATHKRAADAEDLVTAAKTLATMARKREEEGGVYVTAAGEYLPRAPIATRTRAAARRRRHWEEVEEEHEAPPPSPVAATTTASNCLLDDVDDFMQYAPPSPPPPLKRVRRDTDSPPMTTAPPTTVDGVPLDVTILLNLLNRILAVGNTPAATTTTNAMCVM